MERQGRVLLFMLFAACMLGCEDGGGSGSGVTVSNGLDQTINVRYQFTERHHTEYSTTKWKSVDVKPGDTLSIQPIRDDYYLIEVNTAGAAKLFHVSAAEPVLIVTPDAMGL